MIDASEHNWPSYVTLRHYQVAPYFSLTEHSMAPAVLVFSKRVWDTLSADEQTIIRDAAQRFRSDHAPAVGRLRGVAERTVEAAGGNDRDAMSTARHSPTGSCRSTRPIVDDDRLLSMVRRIQADEPLEQSERPKD